MAGVSLDGAGATDVVVVAVVVVVGGGGGRCWTVAVELPLLLTVEADVDTASTAGCGGCTVSGVAEKKPTHQSGATLPYMDLFTGEPLVLCFAIGVR